MKPLKLAFTVCLLLLVAGLVLDTARAENKNWPAPESVTDLSNKKYWPDDPGFGGAWEMYSFIPASAKTSVRKALSSA